MSLQDTYSRSKALDPFRAFWNGIEPFCGGESSIPAFQTSLYYTCAGSDGDVHRHIDFSNAGTEELAALYQACKPAAFGRNGETVLDDAYRKARKLDLDAFATSFDPRSVGILETVSRGLLTGARGSSITEMELYKLNVYGECVFWLARERGAVVLIQSAGIGEGDFFKAHKDTPRSQNMIGSLVVVLPTRHDGGQLVLRHGMQEWTLDFADKLAAATEPMVSFVAFFGDVEHEVLPVTSGYRVTLTYNLYRKPSHPSASYIPTPFQKQFKRTLVELINDKSTLPSGGYLGCGLVHEYVYSKEKSINVLLDQLKGVDEILAIACEELGLRCSLTLVYCIRGFEVRTNLIVKNGRALRPCGYGMEDKTDFYANALEGLTIEEVECVEILGDPKIELDDSEWDFLLPFCRDPLTQILQIRPMSSLTVETPWVYYGNSAELEYAYGDVCLLIAVEPVATRKQHDL